MNMNVFETKINYIVSILTGILSAILGDFWFLFIFLLALNIIDYITGILKARYLRIKSSKMAMKGFVKKFLIWCLIAIGFGLGISFQKIGEILGINLHIMLAIGWFILAHCIINEIRSILENIIELDKGHFVPKWLIKGLEVTDKIIDDKVSGVLNNLNSNIENTEEKI